MSEKLCPKIILEGTRLTLKTEIAFELNEHPREEALAMETYHTWARMFELQRYYSWIIDRFHISTRMYQLMYHGVDCNFLWLGQRLKKLDFRLVLVTRTSKSFDAARIDRLKISGNPS